MEIHRLYHDLELRFDGEMPDHLRRAALAGGTMALEQARLAAASRVSDRMALAAQRAGAAHRAEAPSLLLWRRHGLACLAQLAAIGSRPSLG
jgi:hypothetical protein